jgi:amphi-Trp domain-containing protein
MSATSAPDAQAMPRHVRRQMLDARTHPPINAMPSRDLTKTYTRAQFVAKLRRLADSLESKKAFTIQVGGERLHIPADAVFNIEHERSGKDEELEFQLIWKSETKASGK